MQDLFGSVRRSFSLRSNPAGSNGAAAGEGTGARIVEKIGSCLRKSRVGFGLGLGFSPKLSQAMAKDDSSPIRWRKGELIGCGAFGHVYMGMNLDSGELLAVKQVLIGTNNASKEKAQAHIRELEEEVKLLKNLSHLNIVRYLGTVREEETLNILLEFVPGGSISSLLGKFGSFPEAVIKMYTKQLLQGLEYLHKSGIIHRDIKGANILVDNKGCIKLADFGASKQVAKLATMTAAKSMKGTPYWMAPEVILQTGHTYSADIWSVGCTVIEMATGKPPWSQQYQEVAALFHIGTTKSHPPIPEHLSSEAKNFLLKCLQKEPNLRPSASDLLQHPFVTNDLEGLKAVHCHSATDSSKGTAQVSKSFMNDLSFGDVEHNGGYTECISRLKPIWGTNSCDDMCQIFDKDELPGVESSFNPISEPFDGYPSKNDANLQNVGAYFNDLGKSSNGEGKSTFLCDPTCEDDDDEVTEMKIRAFLDEKAHDLKKLQTPLYEEFFNSLSDIPEAFDRNAGEEHFPGDTELPFLKNSKPFSIKIASPGDTELPFIKNSKPFSGKIAGDSLATCSESSPTRTPRGLNIGLDGNPILREIPSAQLNELEGLQDSQPEDNSPRHKKWKEELDQELERQREMRQANGAGKFSPLHRCASRRRQDRMAFMSPRK